MKDFNINGNVMIYKMKVYVNMMMMENYNLMLKWMIVLFL